MRSLTVLIVEDDPDVRNLIVRVLVRANFSVLEADSALEAFDVSNTFEGVIDLLIADHTLKPMTGRQVAEKISQSRYGLKVLHISGYSLETLQRQGEPISGADFLAKPFLPKDLIGKVNKLLDSAGESIQHGSSASGN